MSILEKQVILNRLRLPLEMIDIIKSYTFYDIYEKTKCNKNETMKYIHTLKIQYGMVFYDAVYRSTYVTLNKKYLLRRHNICPFCGDFSHLFIVEKDGVMVCHCNED